MTRKDFIRAFSLISLSGNHYLKVLRNIGGYNVPADLKYSKDHTWVRITKDDTAEIGLTDYAQSELGDVIYTDIYGLKETMNGFSFAIIEAVKTVCDIYAPVSGNIVSVNKDINNNPAVINTDPYGKGWLIKVDLKNIEEYHILMDDNNYKLYINQKRRKQ